MNKVVDLVTSNSVPVRDDIDSDFFELALEAAPDGVVIVDDTGTIFFVNHQAELLFGWQREQMLGHRIEMLVPERVRHQHPAHRSGYFSTPKTRPMAANLVLTAQRSDGSEFPVDISLSPLETRRGIWVSAAIRDATVRKQAEGELRAANEQMTLALAEMERQRREMAVVGEMGDMIQSCLNTQEAYEIIAASAAKLFPHLSGAVYRPVPTQNELQAVASWGEQSRPKRAMGTGDCWALRRGRLHRSSHTEAAFVCRHSRGRKDELWSLCIPLLAQGEVLGLLLVRQTAADATEIEELQIDEVERLAVTVGEHLSLALANLSLRETLRAQSQRDSLTALYNRRHFDEVLVQEFDRARRDEAALSFLLVDIDNFKNLNDSQGHYEGDSCLRGVARVLLRSTRGDDVVARMGGDEFAVILPGTPVEKALERAETIRFAVDSEMGITVSVGVSILGPSMEGGLELLKAADESLYEAKQAGKNQVGQPRLVASGAAKRRR